VFNDSLPVSSLFCKISLLSLPHYLPARIHCTFLFFCILCFLHHSPFNAPFVFYAFPLLHSTSFFTHASLTTATTTISSLFHILILPVHLVHAPNPMALHVDLYVECSTCSLWKLFSFSICSCHLSIITGCHNQIPSPHHQLRFFIFCYSRAQLFYCSYRLQCSSSCQSPPRTVFVLLPDPLRLLTFSFNHMEVSLSPLAETISGF
jgi:hypothetical protein